MFVAYAYSVMIGLWLVGSGYFRSRSAPRYPVNECSYGIKLRVRSVIRHFPGDLSCQ